MPDVLVTTGQIAKELGYSRQRVDTIIRNAIGEFPEPEAVLANGVRVWRRDVVLRWFREHPRRPYHRSNSAQPEAGA